MSSTDRTEPFVIEGADGHWTEIYLVFEGPVFDLWRQSGLLNDQQPVRHLEPIDYWARQFDSVLGAPRKTGYSPALAEVCRLQAVLAEIVAGNPGDSREREWISKACALLESDLASQFDLHALARRLGISYDSFRKRFARVVGMPPAQYRSHRIIDRACELMRRCLFR